MRTRPFAISASLVILLSFSATDASGQYYDTQVLEKSFDKMDLFFRPNYVNPYGFEGFGAVAPGLIHGPLLDLQVNPAFAALDSTGSRSGYLDFRQSRKPVQQEYYCCDYFYDRVATDAINTSLPYLYYPNQQAPTPEPLFVAAYQAKPSARFAFGLSYQLLFRDSDYFSVPANIYRASATEDFSSTRVADANAAPIVDISGGSNSMRTSGHLASANAAVNLGQVSIGARFAATVFDRNGLRADQNQWTNQYQQLSTSLWSNEESRSTDYQHIDGSLGVIYTLRPKSYVGISGGVLSGNADQILTRADTSFYQDGSLLPAQNFSSYVRGGNTQQTWNHDGATGWLAANALVPIGRRSSLSILYRIEELNSDITLASTVSDTSSSRYRYFYNNDQYASNYRSSLSDVRSGSGTTAGTSHRGAIMAHWQIDKRTKLSLGGDINSRLSTTNTSENVDATLSWFSSNAFDGNPPTNEYMSSERKELNWRFRSRTTTLAFPIHITTTLSPRTRIEFGLNRRLVVWNIQDVTTAAIDYRIITEGATTTRVDDIIERYSEPDSRQSEVRTTLLAGVTVSPTSKLDIRMLVAPEYHRQYGEPNVDLRWWIGLGIHP